MQNTVDLQATLRTALNALDRDHVTHADVCDARLALRDALRSLEPVVEPVPSKRDASHVCRVRAMRLAFKTAQAMGLDCGESWKMRGAIAKYLGRVVSSRRDLSAGQWAEVTAGIELGLIAW